MHSLRHQKAQWPIAFAELKERRDQCKRRENLISGIWLVFFFAILFANVPVTRWISPALDASPWLAVLYVLALFGFLLGNLVFTIRSMKRRLRSYSLECPECRDLLNAKALPIVIATGRCGNCGHLLVSDHPSK